MTDSNANEELRTHFMIADACVNPAVHQAIRRGLPLLRRPVLLLFDGSMPVAQRFAGPGADPSHLVAAVVEDHAAQTVLRKLGAPHLARTLSGDPPVAGLWVAASVTGQSSLGAIPEAAWKDGPVDNKSRAPHTIHKAAVQFAARIDTPSTAVCDFCMGSDPAVVYECNDVFAIGLTAKKEPVDGQLTFHGAWYACEPCALLIDRGDRKALAASSRGLPGIPAELRETVQKAFWLGRTGSKRPIRAEERGPAVRAFSKPQGLPPPTTN